MTAILHVAVTAIGKMNVSAVIQIIIEEMNKNCVISPKVRLTGDIQTEMAVSSGQTDGIRMLMSATLDHIVPPFITIHQAAK